MLPPLLFEASFKINAHMFFAKLRLIVSLTTIVYFETLLIASGFMLPVLVQTQKFKISAVLIFVTIIVATDPVAVVAILEQYGAPHRLKILIEGESLLNDGLALTTYSTLLELGISDHINIPEQLFVLFLNVVISPVMGIIAAKTVSWIVCRLRENKKRQAFILVSVYGVFMLCDKCSCSPALGLCTFGIMLSSHREAIAPETSEVALELWATMGYWANNVIFIFAGFFVGTEMFPDTAYHQLQGSGYLEVDIEDMMTFIEGLLLAPIPLFARIASVYIFYKYYGIISKQPLPPRADFTILAYSGLRGALGLILAMELHNKGMTFSSLATKEGSTKRSKYVRDTCVRLCRFLDVKIREALNVMRLNRSRYLVGTNWHVVKKQTTDCLKKHEAQMENEMMQQQDETALEEITGPGSKERLQHGDVVDARTGYYGILLARVHDSWKRGAISGCSAHIVISILEHGIDEGQITADDIEHYLAAVDFNCFERVMFRISEGLFLWICHDTWLNRFAEIGNCPLVSLVKTDDIHYASSRPFEKWWIFATEIMCFYCVFLAYVNFDDAGDVTRAVIYLFLMVIWIMNVVETLYIIHTNKNDSKSASGNVLMRARIRLAVFYYLHHLMNETKISRDLFSEAAYKIAQAEGKLFNMLVEGLMRLELKENAAEIDVVSVIKTRQAVRMMSYQFETILNSLKTEGFMPADSKEKWSEVVADLRDSADRILWIPSLSFKVTEWIPLNKCRHRHYDTHVVQGEFIAERNILRYETTTYCEMVEVSAEIIGEVVKAEPAVYTIVSNNVQAERLMIELRHTRICWTQITLVAPCAAVDGCLHIRGPADLWVEPADPRAPGMVFFEKRRIEEGVECSARNNSTISFIHYGPSRVSELRPVTRRDCH
ncbi:unnamed protein product [Angiostrongylus costaricensis]|uniref:Na_H_Exchanger domain-containing protein n=1 Tax=Angiostrongylus costaricensis TaxID=334426 RepID=A0A158PJ61_ANGCS|nr:unnamed protein product [Angiostrongylus costaricensis]